MRGGGAKITERNIKDSCENGGIGKATTTSPSGAEDRGTDFRTPYSPRCAVAIDTEGVVIEGEGCFVCAEVYVGLQNRGKIPCRVC